MFVFHINYPLCLLSLQVLGIRQGELDLHGRPRNVTWTRLLQTAVENATSLSLQQAVDWVPGDKIVIAPTGKDGNETEVCKGSLACKALAILHVK